MASDRLTDKQERFVQGLAIGKNQRQAYKDAFLPKKMTDKSVDEKASTLFAQVKIKSRYNELRDKIVKETEQDCIITVKRVMQEYAKLAFYDARKMFNDDGKPKEITELDDDTAACISGLDVADNFEFNGGVKEFVGYTKKYKLADKKGALDSIAKTLGMFVDKTELTIKEMPSIKISK